MTAGAERRERWLEMPSSRPNVSIRAPTRDALQARLEEEPGAAGRSTRSRSRPSATRISDRREVLERRVASAPDDAARSAVLQKLGAVYADRLKDHAGAMRAWRRVLEINRHAKALRVLRDSFLAIGDFDGLASSTLRRTIGKGSSTSSRRSRQATDAKRK